MQSSMISPDRLLGIERETVFWMRRHLSLRELGAGWKSRHLPIVSLGRSRPLGRRLRRWIPLNFSDTRQTHD